MRPLKRPLAAFFALAYLSASWLAAALHSHAGHAHVSAPGKAVCDTGHCCHHHGHGHDHGREKQANGPPGDDSHNPCEHDEHHHCVVCEFLAKPPLVVEPLSLPASAMPVVPAVEPGAPAIEATAACPWWSRGPPVA